MSQVRAVHTPNEAMGSSFSTPRGEYGKLVSSLPLRHPLIPPTLLDFCPKVRVSSEKKKSPQLETT